MEKNAFLSSKLSNQHLWRKDDVLSHPFLQVFALGFFARTAVQIMSVMQWRKIITPSNNDRALCETNSSGYNTRAFKIFLISFPKSWSSNSNGVWSKNQKENRNCLTKPRSIWYITTPKLYHSTTFVYGSPSSTSGAKEWVTMCDKLNPH